MQTKGAEMLTPTTEHELADCISAATSPFRIQGGGTRPIGLVANGCTPLSTSGLNGISLYEPGALTIVVKSGTPLSDVKAALTAQNQRLPFEPPDYRALLGTDGTPTIGAVAAMNLSGPRRVQVGAARDYMLGVRFVNGSGQILKNGGRVMKNVTGYDLVKLLAGSYGTLGILTEVALKVLPSVEETATLSLSDLSPDQAVRALASALGSPFEINGAAHDPATAQTYFRLEGFRASVQYRSERLAALLEPFGEVAKIDDATSIWTDIRDVRPFAGLPGDVWRLSIKATDAPSLLDRAAPLGSMLDWGGGLLWLRMSEGTDLRAKLGNFAGHATLIRANDETKARIPTFHPEAAPLAAIADGLRQKFDPRGILNPGIMG